MNKNSVCINVNVKTVISRSTAEICLKIVEAYVNDGYANIIVERRPDGSAEYHFDEVSRVDT